MILAINPLLLYIKQRASNIKDESKKLKFKDDFSYFKKYVNIIKGLICLCIL